MGPVGITFAIVGGLLGAALVAGAVLYAIDFQVDATVQETDCDLLQVKVQTKLFGIDHTVTDLPADQCRAISPGNFVEYRLRTQRTTLYETEGGDCLYDSETGPYCGDPRGTGAGLPFVG